MPAHLIALVRNLASSWRVDRRGVPTWRLRAALCVLCWCGVGLMDGLMLVDESSCPYLSLLALHTARTLHNSFFWDLWCGVSTSYSAPWPLQDHQRQNIHHPQHAKARFALCLTRISAGHVDAVRLNSQNSTSRHRLSSYTCDNAVKQATQVNALFVCVQLPGLQAVFYSVASAAVSVNPAVNPLAVRPHGKEGQQQQQW